MLRREINKKVAFSVAFLGIPIPLLIFWVAVISAKKTQAPTPQAPKTTSANL